MTPDYKPDFTAWFVLQGWLAAMHRPEFAAQFDKKKIAMASRLAHAASRTRMSSRLIHALPFGLQYFIGDLVTSSGRLRHFCLRKMEIERCVRQALDEGAKQVVVLGAGLDLLACRLASDYTSVKFIEIDMESSQIFKEDALEAEGGQLPVNVELLSGDLRQSLDQTLFKSKTFQRSQKTVWVAEGVLMFLPDEAVRRLFTEIKLLSASGSPVVFTTLPSKRLTPAFGHFMQTVFLKREKSPFQWVLPFDKMSEYVDNLGFTMQWQIDHAALHNKSDPNKSDNPQSLADNIHLAIS